MPKRALSKVELEQQFEVQQRFLQKSCDEYDAGDEDEARRIAVTLRILLHDTRRSRALISTLGMGDTLFFDTAEDVLRTNLLPTFGLVMAHFSGSECRYLAPVGEHPSPRGAWLIPFEFWWNKTVICVPGAFEVTRKDLILSMADQDGGAHVDPSLEEDYYRLTRENVIGTVATIGGQEYPIPHIASASVRQIAQEVLVTFVRPFKMIPGDLPDEQGEEYVSSVFDARTGERRTEVRRRRVLCMCHSGLPYSECHAKGGKNHGKIVPPLVT